MRYFYSLLAILFFLCLFSLPVNALGFMGGQRSYEFPEWFKDSFLTLEDDLSEAKAQKKQVILFFYIKGCPYCERMIRESIPPHADFTKNHFDVIPIDKFGSREVTTIDGQKFTEKKLARKYRILFTPTLIFLNEKGQTAFRINGYWPPENFRNALEYVRNKNENQTFRHFMKAKSQSGSYSFLSNPHFTKETVLTSTDKPLLLIFEDKNCEICREVHRDLLSARNVDNQLKNFKVVRFDRDSLKSITNPWGKPSTPKDLAARLGVTFSPSFIFFDQGKERNRIEGRVFNFHFVSSLLYVQQKKYLTYNNWLAFNKSRQDDLLAKGIHFDIGQQKPGSEY